MYSEIFITIAALFILRYFIKYLLDPLRKIPGPNGLPFVGNMLDFYRNPDTRDLHQRWTKEYGPIYKYYLPFVGWRIYVADAKYAKQILVSNCSKYAVSEMRKKIVPAFGSGLITSNGKVHAYQRKHLNPEFSLASIKKYTPIFNLKANELIQLWETQIKLNNGKPIEEDILKKLSHLTLDVIGLSSFGYSFNCVSGGDDEGSLAAGKILSANFNFLRRSFEYMLPFLKIFPSKERTELENAEKSFYGLINKVIQARQEEFQSETSHANERNDLLQTLFAMYQDGDKETAAKNIFHQVFSFMIAGYDTLSVTMTWTIYCLAKHPEIQRRVQKEINEVIGSSNQVCWEELDNLKFLDCCIKEAMRFYPTLIFVARTAVKEDRIGPHQIPAGSYVHVGSGALFRDESFWKDPDSYNPDRFDYSSNDSIETERKDFPYWFLPFSRGPRMCIGYRFAEVELKVVLALLLRSFSFKLSKNQPDDVETRMHLTLKPAQPIILDISLNERD